MRGGGQKRYILLSLLLLSTAVLTYQAVTGLFVVLNLPPLLQEAHAPKRFLRGNAIVAAIYGLSGVVALLYMQVFVQSNRVHAAGSSFLQRLYVAGKSIVGLMNQFLPGVFLLTVLFLLAALVVLALQQSTGRPLRLFSIAYLVLGTAAATLMPCLFYDQDYSWRVVYPMGGIVGLLLLWSLMQQPQRNGRDGWLRRTVCMVTALFCLAVWARFQVAWVRRFWENAQENLIASTVSEQVAAYEQASGETVTKISFYFDSDPTGSEHVAAYHKAWSRNTFFSVLVGRQWQEVPNDPAHAEYFSARNWNAYSEEQLIFDGDTLHLCIW